MMNIILGMSLAGSAVLLVWWLANAVRGNRLPARWHYRVLKASLLFMLVPVGWVSTLVGQWLDARAPAPVLPETVPYVPNLPPVEVLPSPGAITAPLPEATAPAAALSIDLFRLLTVLWAVGAAVMLVYKLLMYRRFRCQVFRQNQEVSAPETLQMFDACKQRLGIREPVDVRENPLLRTSLATGLLRPMIVLPAMPLSVEELRYLFLHELTHIKSKDLWVRFCSLLALCIHWYNPLMHLLNRKIQEVSEQNCDERVVSPLSRLERCAYGHVILKLASDMAVGSGSWAAPLSTKQTLERRLIRVLHTEKLKGRRRFLSVILAVVILACGTTAALAAQKNLPEPEIDPSVQKDIDENSRLRQMLNQREAANTAAWFAPEDIYDIQSAELVWWDGTTLSPADPAAPVYLESLLGGASQTTSTDCPFHSVLYLQRADGVLGKILLAEDSCAVFQSNGVCYRFDAADNREFYALFGPETAGLPQWNTAAAMEQLKNSITYQGGRFSFTIPAGTASWDIHIAGRLDAGGGMSVHYLDGETWTPGKTYSFQTDGACTELTMDIALDGQETSVDLLPYIQEPSPESSESETAAAALDHAAGMAIDEEKESVVNTGVLYPDAVRGDTALILSRGGTLLPDDDPSSYVNIDGIIYKDYRDKNGVDRREARLGNKDYLNDNQLLMIASLVNGEYPKNSRGESYGTNILENYVGYAPDLIAAQGTNGESGYICKADREALPHDLPADECPHEFLIPLYDREHNVIGEFPVDCGGHLNPAATGMSVEEAKAVLDNGYQDSGPVKDTQELMDRLREENLVDGQYPTTADGKTYGVLGLVRDQHPDLVCVIASNGKSGYAKYEEFDPYGALLSDPDTTPEELAAAKALLNDCVRTMIPVYDLEGNIVGEYETYAFPS